VTYMPSTHSATVETSVPALGLTDGDVILLALHEPEPVMLFRALNAVPLAFVARALLLALDMGHLTPTDPEFRKVLDGLATSRPYHSPKTSPEPRKLALVGRGEGAP
jgi:hypothetical protein